MSFKADKDCSSFSQVQHNRLMLEGRKDDFENLPLTKVFKE